MASLRKRCLNKGWKGEEASSVDVLIPKEEQSWEMGQPVRRPEAGVCLAWSRPARVEGEVRGEAGSRRG